MKIKAIAFDFDGVIVESTEIKTDAFKDLFSRFQHKFIEIVRYLKENEGVSRYKKFRFIYQSILNMPYNSEIETELDERFSRIVIEKIKKCDFVNGAVQFLERYQNLYPIYLISSTPDKELEEIVREKGISGYFISVNGSSRNKSLWLENILNKEKIKPSNLLFVGDTLNDYMSAVDTKVLFIGRIRPDNENLFPSEGLLAVVRDLNELHDLIDEHNSY